MKALNKAIREIESYLKKRKGKKIEKRMERFYEENFAKDEVEPGTENNHGVFMKKTATHKRVKKKVEKIKPEAENLDIPSSALAGFCYLELTREGIKLMHQNDAKFSNKMEWQNSSNVTKDLIENSIYRAMNSENPQLTNVGEFEYKLALEKFQACITISEKFELGETFREIAERNETRIERRLKYFAVMEEAIQEEKPEEAEAALEDYIEFVEGQKERIENEEQALKENTEKWMT